MVCMFTLAAPAPHAPAALINEGLQPSATALAAAWELAPTAQTKWTCGAGQRNADVSECLAAVVTATSGAANGHIKLVDTAAVPPGCSYSRVSGAAMFNAGAGQVGSEREDYQLVCRPSGQPPAFAPQEDGESVPICAMAPLPAGSHIILVNRNTDAEFRLNGMYRRFIAVLEALTSQGVVVHLVFYERSKNAPKPKSGQLEYNGTMWQQYNAAKVAAGKQLRLGVVFATALTMRLERQLLAASKRKSDGTPSYEESWDGGSLSALFKETEFTDEWPEEAVMNQLHHDGLPVAVVTDDIHYKRAPYVVEASVCKRDTGCASAVEVYFKQRELSLYASAQLVFTVTMEVRVARKIRSAYVLA